MSELLETIGISNSNHRMTWMTFLSTNVSSWLNTQTPTDARCCSWRQRRLCWSSLLLSGTRWIGSYTNSTWDQVEVKKQN